MSSFAGWRVREKERVSEGECERGIFKVSPLKRLAVHVYTDQWSVSPVHRRQTGRRSLTHRKSYTLLWDGGQRLLLFLPSSCHSEVSVLRSHRLFVYALGPSIAQRAEIWSRNLNSVFVKWRNSGSKKKKKLTVLKYPKLSDGSEVSRGFGQMLQTVWTSASRFRFKHYFLMLMHVNRLTCGPRYILGQKTIQTSLRMLMWWFDQVICYGSLLHVGLGSWNPTGRPPHPRGLGSPNKERPCCLWTRPPQRLSHSES